MKCWSYMALWLPDFFKQTPPLPTHFPSSNILLWPSCALGSPGLPHRQQAGLAVGVAENLFCRVHSVCTSTHSRIQSSPHDSDPPHASLHRCCRELHHPTQYCAMTAKQPSPAAPHTAAHPRPSPCTRILTHVIRIPNTVSLAYSTQDKPVSVPSRYYIWSVSEIARLLYTRVPPCPRKSSCPKYVQPYHHPFAAATPWPVPCP